MDLEQFQNNDKNFIVITDISFWEILLGKDGREKNCKYSRTEAFCDLLRRQKLVLLGYTNSLVNGGLQELADKWRWNRSTVRKFITELSRAGVLSTELTPQKRTIIKMVAVKLKNETQNDAGNIYGGRQKID